MWNYLTQLAYSMYTCLRKTELIGLRVNTRLNDLRVESVCRGLTYGVTLQGLYLHTSALIWWKGDSKLSDCYLQVPETEYTHVQQVCMKLWCLTSGLYNISRLHNTTPTTRDNCTTQSNQTLPQQELTLFKGLCLSNPTSESQCVGRGSDPGHDTLSALWSLYVRSPFQFSSLSE